MMKIKIKPATGTHGGTLRVVDPETHLEIPADVATEVKLSAYWSRRLKDGDVVLATSAKKKKTTKRGAAAKNGG